jgi:simple sugar transport system ATP-binding protein
MAESITQPASDFLRLEQISKTFGGVRALRGVDLTIGAGQIYHLLGENGSGKSTLIKIISGAQPPDSGTILVRGQRYQKLSALESLKAGIETVYQDLSLFPNLSVAENVALNAQLLNSNGSLARVLNRKSLEQVAATALTRVGLPSRKAFLETKIETLPIAVRQLVAIARGIATQATLVIMDEPTAALTQKEVENLMGIVEGLRREGVSVLFVSHKLDEVFRIGGQVIVFRDGQKVAEGDLQDYSKEDISYLMTGKRLDNHRYRLGQPSSQLLLEVQDLSLGDRFEAVSFKLHKGEILGITGLLDSGRNELAKALAGVQVADRGRLILEQQEIKLKNPGDAIALGIGYVPEDRLTEGLFLKKPIRENIAVSILHRLLRRNQIDNKKITQVAQDAVKNLNIATPDVMLPAQALSGGNQQRVMVARWLATHPKVLILHGPTMGVDVGSKDALYKIIQDLATRGLGVIIVSDDLPELLQNCDCIMIMKKGRMTHLLEAEAITPEQLSKELLLEAA